MNNLLAALGCAKPYGKDRWRSKCPVHGGKNPTSLVIRLDQNNNVLAHCHSCGANGLDLYKALDLDLDELFGGRESNSVPQYVRDQYQEDRFFTEVYKSDVARGVRPIYHDTKRMKLATARMEGARTKYGIV